MSKQNTLSLKIGWLYPDLMSTYGDRGNITVLTKRCEWRNITVEVLPITQTTTHKQLESVDLLFGGGAQDMEQEIVMRDLRGKKAEAIQDIIESDKPALFVCGAPQIMGKYYEPAVGKRIEGLGIFDMVTENPGPDAPRLIGNTVAKVLWKNLHVISSASQRSHGDFSASPRNDNLIIGFENHGGRTYLGETVKPFAKVIKGFGNNGKDGTEGVVYRNTIGCYFHGPLLPKNPHIADWLIKTALEVKYQKNFTLSPLEDSLEWQAHDMIVKRLGVHV